MNPLNCEKYVYYNFFIICIMNLTFSKCLIYRNGAADFHIDQINTESKFP